MNQEHHGCTRRPRSPRAGDCRDVGGNEPCPEIFGRPL